MRLDGDTLARMLKLRILLCGGGAFSADVAPVLAGPGQDGQSDVQTLAFCVLPSGSAIRLTRDGAGIERAQTFHASGKPRCEALDLAAPGIAVQLMYAVDSGIWDKNSNTHRGMPGQVPPFELAALVDHLVASQDPDVVDMVEAVYAGGAAIDLGDLDQLWAVGEQCGSFYDAALISGEPPLHGAAQALMNAVYEPELAGEFDARTAMDRCEDFAGLLAARPPGLRMG